ncbi:hypothetical protein, partial [Alkalilimnicola ehrlichii]|uniref:hypothetical protein n=1 Tax=Alkalilimnicola ehrlichii TaxID=351052 RepID=UPI001C6E4A16
ADTPTRLVRRRDAPEHPALNLLMEQLAARCLTPRGKKPENSRSTLYLITAQGQPMPPYPDAG